MIKDKVFAKEVVEMLLDCSGRLDESVARAQKQCSEAEFLAYRKAIRDVMSETFDQLLLPIFAAHPELKPKELE
ncbi:MAG TPA: hypothetical protein VFV71_08605 [Burkholderiales bacterium]|nr:hypothetical protein [Burkholderiales bacterium]